MSQTLFYTSSRQGLRPLSSGFCTVAHSAGMPMATIDRLEALSGYGLHDDSPAHAAAPASPVIYSYRKNNSASAQLTVLSRIAPAALDNTRRLNHLAQHIVLGVSERATAGPAWLISQRNLFDETFDGGPRLLPQSLLLPSAEVDTEIIDTCPTWTNLTGDGRWAGEWADRWLAQPARPMMLIYPAQADILRLLREAFALLPPDRRWQATFTTAYTAATIAGGAECVWRCIPAPSPAAEEARLFSRDANRLLDLTQPPRQFMQSGSGLVLGPVHRRTALAPTAPTTLP